MDFTQIPRYITANSLPLPGYGVIPHFIYIQIMLYSVELKAA